jgi:hypothetical protein
LALVASTQLINCRASLVAYDSAIRIGTRMNSTITAIMMDAASVLLPPTPESTRR